MIVFRSCTPLAQVFLDYLFLNHALPSPRSLLALSGVALGAYAYMRTDSEFQLKVWSLSMDGWGSGEFANEISPSGTLIFSFTFPLFLMDARCPVPFETDHIIPDAIDPFPY